ncbi:transposase [Streptomyces sp. NPDC002185]|uniref:transposase n=1 Tax=Streptomyces sp. NPDC002185 TaxID=3364636 RepID=UPI00367B47F1
MWPLNSGNGCDSARLQAAGPCMARILVGLVPGPEERPPCGSSSLRRTTAAQPRPPYGYDEPRVVIPAPRSRWGTERSLRLKRASLGRRPRLARLVKRHGPQLLGVVGIGPDTVVTLLITMGDNPERLGSEASFAALCGVSPVERSSGARQYRRRNRGGDRSANAALHWIVQTRQRFDPRTQEYYERRTWQGKTRREIGRCLNRYAGREVFHLVSATHLYPSL